MRRYRSALGRRDLRRLLTGLLISATGSWAYNVALLAFIFSSTHSLGWVGAAGIGRFVPQLLTSAYGGVLAERFERIRLMVCSDLLCAVWQAGLAVVAVAGGPPLLAIILAALTSVSGVVYAPATAAMIPSLVDEDDLAAANALNSTIDQLVVIAGPAVGALLLVVASSGAVFAVNAASFVISALLVRSIRTRSRPVDVTGAGEAGPFEQMMVGVRTIVRLPAARTLVAYSVLVSFVYGADTVLFVGVSAHRLGTGPEGFGYLMAGLGIGGLVIAGLVDRLAASERLAPIILLGAVGYCLPTALLTVIHSPVLAFLLEMVRGASTIVVDVLAVTSLQRSVAPELLARVFGVFFAFVLAAIALGTILTPVLIGALGLNTGLWAMAVGPALVAVAGFPSLLAVDRATAQQARQLRPRVARLEGLGLFAGASRPILERLAGAAVDVEFGSGEVIVREGAPADAVYVLASGSVRVTASGEGGGPETVLRTMAAPAFFGEIGVLEQIPRTATVTAEGACRCECIDGEGLLEALTASPPSSGLIDTARSRLALTHPSRRLGFSGPERGAGMGPERGAGTGA